MNFLTIEGQMEIHLNHMITKVVIRLVDLLE